MSNWIDIYQEEIICPVCNRPFIAYLFEDGDINRQPIMVTSLAGGFAICSYCSAFLTDKDLS